MGISIESWRAAIGNYHFKGTVPLKLRYIPHHIFFDRFNTNFLYGRREWAKLVYKTSYYTVQKIRIDSIIATTVIIQMLLICAGIHPNPGPIGNTEHCDITICHANVRSLKSRDKYGILDKYMYIKCNLARKFDIITLSETWLTEAHHSKDFHLNGYQQPFRKDRSVPDGILGYGGVLAWISNTIACKR